MTPDSPDAARKLARLFAACFTLMLVQIGYAVSTRTWMADESAHHFFGLLMDEQVFFHTERFAALALHRGATWLLLDGLGVHDLGLLMTVFGVSLYAAWPLSLLICWRLVRDTDPYLVLFPVLAYALGSANAGLFTASESHCMHALYWPALLGLLTAGESRARRTWVLVALALLPFTYAATAVLALPLAAVALAQARRRAAFGWYDYACLGWTACALVLGVRGYALRSELAVSVADGFALALSGTPVHVNLLLCTAALTIVATWVLPLAEGVRRAGSAVVVLLAVGCVAYHAAVPGHAQPDVYGHFVRGLNTLVPLALTALLAVYLRRDAFRANLRASAPAVHALWAGQVLFLASVTWQFSDYVDYLRAFSSGRSGVIPVRTPAYMEKADYDLFRRNGSLFHRPVSGRTPLYAFTSMWVAAPAHCLLYSDESIDVMIIPSTLLQPEYEQVFTEQGRAKLARFGLQVGIDPQRVLAEQGD